MPRFASQHNRAAADRDHVPLPARTACGDPGPARPHPHRTTSESSRGLMHRGMRTSARGAASALVASRYAEHRMRRATILRTAASGPSELRSSSTSTHVPSSPCRVTPPSESISVMGGRRKPTSPPHNAPWRLGSAPCRMRCCCCLWCPMLHSVCVGTCFGRALDVLWTCFGRGCLRCAWGGCFKASDPDAHRERLPRQHSRPRLALPLLMRIRPFRVTRAAPRPWQH